VVHVTGEAGARYTARFGEYIHCHKEFMQTGGECPFDFTGNWLPIERDATGWLRWSDGHGSISFQANQAGELVFEAKALSAPRPNRLDVALNGKPVASLNIDNLDWTFHPIGPVALAVSAGVNTLTLTSREPPLMGGDKRPRGIAFRGMTLRTKDGRPLCEAADCAMAPSKAKATGTASPARVLPSERL
jgi:hypothetical protein